MQLGIGEGQQKVLKPKPKPGLLSLSLSASPCMLYNLWWWHERVFDGIDVSKQMDLWVDMWSAINSLKVNIDVCRLYITVLVR